MVTPKSNDIICFIYKAFSQQKMSFINFYTLHTAFIDQHIAIRQCIDVSIFNLQYQVLRYVDASQYCPISSTNYQYQF